MKNKFLLLAFIFLSVGTMQAKNAADSASTVIVYPAIPGLTTSDVYSVKANDQDIWTEKFRTTMDIGKLPDWFITPYTKVQQEIHQASFSCTWEGSDFYSCFQRHKNSFNTPPKPRNKNRRERKCFDLFNPRTR